MEARDVRADQVARDERVRNRLRDTRAEVDLVAKQAVAGDQVPGRRRRAADPGVGLGARIAAAAVRRERLCSGRVGSDEAALEDEIRMRARGRDRLVGAPVHDESADRDVVGRGQEARRGAGVGPVDLDRQDRVEALAGRIRVGRGTRLGVPVDRHGVRDRRQRGGRRDRVHTRPDDPVGDRVGARAGVGVRDGLSERPRAGIRRRGHRVGRGLERDGGSGETQRGQGRTAAKGHGSSCSLLGG